MKLDFNFNNKMKVLSMTIYVYQFILYSPEHGKFYQEFTSIGKVIKVRDSAKISFRGTVLLNSIKIMPPLKLSLASMKLRPWKI